MGVPCVVAGRRGAKRKGRHLLYSMLPFEERSDVRGDVCQCVAAFCIEQFQAHFYFDDSQPPMSILH